MSEVGLLLSTGEISLLCILPLRSEIEHSLSADQSTLTRGTHRLLKQLWRRIAYTLPSTSVADLRTPAAACAACKLRDMKAVTPSYRP